MCSKRALINPYKEPYTSGKELYEYRASPTYIARPRQGTRSLTLRLLTATYIARPRQSTRAARSLSAAGYGYGSEAPGYYHQLLSVTISYGRAHGQLEPLSAAGYGYGSEAPGYYQLLSVTVSYYQVCARVRGNNEEKNATCARSGVYLR